MKKILTKIIGASLAIAMMIGVGVGVNANKVAKPVDATIDPASNEVAYEVAFTKGANDSGTTAPSIASGTAYATLGTSSKAYARTKGLHLGSASDVGSQIVNLKTGENGGQIQATYLSVYAIEVDAGKNLKTTVTYTDSTTATNTTATSSTLTYIDIALNSSKTISSIKFESTQKSKGRVAVDSFKIYKESTSSIVLTDLVIASGEESVKKDYLAGESFNPTGLVIQAEWDNVLDTNTNVVNDVVWAPDPLTAGTTTVTGTYTSGDVEKTVTITGLTVVAPDYILDGNDNAPAGLEVTHTVDTTSVGEGQINASGVKYGYYGLAIFDDTHNLEFNKTLSGAYICNNESFGKNIDKIKVTLQNDVFNKITMYKGDLKNPTTSAVTGTGNGTTRIYDFNDNVEYFSLKQTATGTWVQIVKIEIFLGSIAPVIDAVTAVINGEIHYVGDTLSASDFTVTVGWTGGKADTNPTEGFTWTVNGDENGELAEGNNSVVVTYGGVQSDPITVVGSTYNARRYLNSIGTVKNVDGTQGAVPTGEISNDTFVFANNGYGNGEEVTDVVIGQVSLSCSAGEGSNTPKYYDAGTGLRAYNENTLTFTALTNISQISFTFSGSYSSGLAVMDDNGEYSNGTWTGESKTVVIKYTPTSGHVRIQTISVTYEEGTPSVDHVGLRFGATIPQADWTIINNKWTISDYGVMFMKKTTMQNNYEGKSIAEAYFDDGLRPNANVHKGSGEVPVEEGDDYVFTARINMTNINNYGIVYVAAPYIIAGGEVFFLEEMEYSVNTMAQYYLTHSGSNLSNAALTILAGNQGD